MPRSGVTQERLDKWNTELAVVRNEVNKLTGATIADRLPSYTLEIINLKLDLLIRLTNLVLERLDVDA